MSGSGYVRKPRMFVNHRLSPIALRQCPRFDRCTVPICPLDPDQDLRTHLPGEPRCALAKSIRHRIGKEPGLPCQGLTKREWASLQIWQNLPASEAARRTTILHGFSRFRPVSQKEKAEVG